ncbi:hypothetical protein BU14_0334s0012 [Porphyra umbilicalis]|uniref:Uncharacterized protein n=1 Tax=Porphyra umbilicalis TaxID=2786 RepID=A0A1X6NYJ4_PORUM|nr:hypothetical protein BU14_0334s0012 [Porphyra umbilicalis]|eukprot:OSX73610.1 hypothetical protein BU14_0334s0012 [Porphyra umbilicalis]
MSLLRAAGVAARSVSAAAGPSVARRTAIVATVSKASDTSAMDFAAPASFDVAATGRRAAADLRTFFMDGESKIELDEADRAAVVSSVRATAAGLSADSTLDVNAAVASVGVKDSYKLSDLTYFDVFQKARKA